MKLLDKEIQYFKYQKHEENRKKYIEEAKKTRNDLKKRQKKNLKKSFSSSYIITQGKKKIKKWKNSSEFLWETTNRWIIKYYWKRI